jgi:phosphomannomutase
MGYGFSRMNALVIVQTTQGILQHLIGKHSLSELQERGVVVGHDHRYQSFDFAHLVTAVFLSKKVKVYFFREICHTPLVPFGLKKLKVGYRYTFT